MSKQDDLTAIPTRDCDECGKTVSAWIWGGDLAFCPECFLLALRATADGGNAAKGEGR